MQAWAAGAATEGHAAEAFYMTAEFWVFVAFVILIAAIGKKAYRVVVVALDDRATTIRNQIDEATRLREEAQELLASYERKQHEASGEAEQVLERARAEAERLRAQAAENLEKTLERAENMAKERIAQAEAAALDEVRTMAVDIALEATRRILADELPAKKIDAMVDAAIEDLPGKLN